MTLSNGVRLVLAVAVLGAGAGVLAQEPGPLGQDRPLADERCIEQCDVESDKCMQSADGDPAKLQACDDKYSECLQACERAPSQ
jgi:hypothetical protein